MSMPSRLTFLTQLFAIFTICTTAQAATYYVDRQLPGSDSNNGTGEATAFLTIRKCVAVASNPGDTCLVKNGTYPEPFAMRYSGAADNPITLKNYSGHKPKIQFSDTSNPNNQIYIGASSYPNAIRYITIEGFEISNGYYGIKYDSAENLIIRKNYIHHIGTVPDPNGSPGSRGQVGIGGTGYQVTIDGNLVAQVGGFGNENPVEGTSLYLIGQSYVITNNIIYHNARYGIQLAAYAYDPSKHANVNHSGFSGLVANNTVAYEYRGAGITLWNPNGGTIPVSGVTIANNILYENNDLSSVSGINFLNLGNVHVQLKNNVFYDTKPSGTTFVSSNTGGVGSVYDLSNNSTATNPNMVNAPANLPASPDFHLTTGSLVAIDLGLDLSASGIRTDFAGLNRPANNGYDVGAYEFSSNRASLSPPSNLRVH
jgi:hypothetical protein